MKLTVAPVTSVRKTAWHVQPQLCTHHMKQLCASIILHTGVQHSQIHITYKYCKREILATTLSYKDTMIPIRTHSLALWFGNKAKGTLTSTTRLVGNTTFRHQSDTTHLLFIWDATMGYNACDYYSSQYILPWVYRYTLGH